MNMIAQEARKKQETVIQAIKNEKNKTSRKYKVGLSTLKRLCEKYNGTWQSMLEKSHRPQATRNDTQQKRKNFKNLKINA